MEALETCCQYEEMTDSKNNSVYTCIIEYFILYLIKQKVFKLKLIFFMDIKKYNHNKYFTFYSLQRKKGKFLSPIMLLYEGQSKGFI